MYANPNPNPKLEVELCAMYAIADVAMITSLRDGFNKARAVDV